MPDDPITEAVKQAAREAVAKRLVRDRQHGTASDVRHGYLDHRADVADAIAGALAAVPVVREMVRAEADEAAVGLVRALDVFMGDHQGSCGGCALCEPVMAARARIKVEVGDDR